jgi:hypothetical protein
MILGMSLSTFTLVHVLISLLGIGSGLIVMYGFLTAKRLNGWTATFLVSTIATSVTGFLFPYNGVTPGIKLGILSLIALAGAVITRYATQMRGASRWIYVITASIALYFNVFVLVAQLFEKVPAIHALAPTQKEPPFAIAQLLVLALFIALTLMAVRRFHPAGSGSSNSGLSTNAPRRAA